jgi:hypothetical protein
MKQLVILSAIAAGSLFISKANAQVSIQFGINIPTHRVYVPAPQPPVVEEPAYDDNDNVNVSDDDDYYYLPEVEAYYNVGAGCYYYNDGSRWVSCAYLPGAYHDYNWRTAVRYEVRASRPFMRHDYYRSRWGGYAGDRNNWGHRFDRRPVGDYAYRPNWGGDRNRGDWGRRPNPYDNRGNWGGRPNGGDNRGGWGNRQPNNGDHGNHGGWGNGQPNNGGHDNHGGWGNGQQPGNGQPNNGGHDNHGGWGNGQQPGNGQPNNGGHDNHGGWGNGQQPGNGQPNNGGHDNHGGGNGQPTNGGGHDRGNGGERFTQNGNGGRGMRRF